MLIDQGKKVFVIPTLIAGAIALGGAITLHWLLTPAAGILVTLLASALLAVTGTAVVSWYWIVAPLQGSLDHITRRLQGEGGAVAANGHGFDDQDLRRHRRIGQRHGEISDGLERFHEMTGSLVENGSRIAIAAAEVSFAADGLSDSVHREVADIRAIADSASRISEIVEQAAASASNAADFARQTREASSEGEQKVRGAVEQMRQTTRRAEETSAIIASLEGKSGQIQQITSVISGIAEQTNLLALNAAIEAARAGEQGRGFAVVADEVRNLARKTAEATGEIGQMVDQIGTDIEQAVGTMSGLVEAIVDGTGRTEAVGEQLALIHRHSENMQQQVEGIAGGTEQNAAEVARISTAIQSVSSHLSETEVEIQGVAEQASRLSTMAEQIHVLLMDFNHDSLHCRMRQIAADAAAEVGRVFEQAVASGRLGSDDLFDRDYQPIPDTDPQKYKTRFDDFTDQVLPPIQERILEQHPEIAYAGAVDDNGYFPTHNRRFSRPLTGDYQTDLVNNRTKRIFDDPTGRRCGSHTQPFLLQTYKRDTGEVMHDISVPIHVGGRHWGGFRMGYKAEEQSG